MGLRLKFNIILILTCLIGMTAVSALTLWMARTFPGELAQSLGKTPDQGKPDTQAVVTEIDVKTRFLTDFSKDRYVFADPWRDAGLKGVLVPPAQLAQKLEPVPALVPAVDQPRVETAALAQEENKIRGWALSAMLGPKLMTGPLANLSEGELRMSVGLLGGFLVVVVFIMLVMNYVLSRLVLRPVAAMKEITDRISVGDFSSPNYRKYGSDEISVLTGSFDKMRRALDRAVRLLESKL